MSIHSSTFDFWREEGLRYIIPPGKDVFPEGWDPRPFLVKLSDGLDTVELGCGVGRLAGCFDKSKYLGVDINPGAIDVARQTYEGYRFELLDFNQPLPDAAYYFAYTVFLHIDDETLPKILAAIPKSCTRFCIAEMMGREWRMEEQTNPPVFNRAEREYVELMAHAGFKIVEAYDFPYIHYYRKLLGTEFEGKVNTNLDVLAFERYEK